MTRFTSSSILALALIALCCTAEPDHISLLREVPDAGSSGMDAAGAGGTRSDAATAEAGQPVRQCAGDGECGAPLPYCDIPSGTCVECLGDPNCLVGTCDPASHRCIESCSTNTECSEGYCNLETGRCVECTSSADCYSSEQPLCNTTLGRCVECLTNAECATGLCLASRGACADCRIDADCELGKVCDLTRFECTG